MERVIHSKKLTSRREIVSNYRGRRGAASNEIGGPRGRLVRYAGPVSSSEGNARG